MNRSLRKLRLLRTRGLIVAGLSVLPCISPLVAEGAGRVRFVQSAYDESDDGPSLGPAFGSPSIDAGDARDLGDIPDAPPISAPTPPRMLQTPPAMSPAQAAVNAKRRSQTPTRTQAPSSNPYPGSTQAPNQMPPSGRTHSSTRAKMRGPMQPPARTQSQARSAPAQQFDPPVPTRPPLQSRAPEPWSAAGRARPPVNTQSPSNYAPPSYGAASNSAGNYNDVPTVEGVSPQTTPQKATSNRMPQQRSTPRATPNWMQSRQPNSRPMSTQQMSTPQPTPRQQMSRPMSRPISSAPMSEPEPSVEPATAESGPELAESFNEIPTIETVDVVDAAPSPEPEVVQQAPEQYQSAPAPTPKRSFNQLAGKFTRQAADAEYEEPSTVETVGNMEDPNSGRKRWRWNPFAKQDAPPQLATPEATKNRLGRFQLKGAAPLEEAPLYSDAPTFEEYSSAGVASAPPQESAEQPSRGWRWPWSAK